MEAGTSQLGVQQFENLVANIPGIVYRCENDEHWTMHFISGRVTEITGYPPSDFIGNQVRSFASLIHPDDEARVGQVVVEALDNREPFSVEYRITNSNDEIVWVLEKGQGVYDSEDNLLWLDGVILDVSEQKQLENLKQEVDRMMRHDLRAPLNTMITLPQVIKKNWQLDDDQFYAIEMIEKSGKKMLNMLNLSLDLYKMEIGQYDFKPEEVNVLNVLDIVVSDLQQLLQIYNVHVLVRYHGKKRTDSDEMIMHAEQLLCYSIFSNLLKNAIEASEPSGTVQIDLSSKDFHLISFHNETEVPKEIRETFFDKYVTSGKKGGTGLGTYIAKLMVQVQNGSIQLNSSNGATTVTISFPK